DFYVKTDLDAQYRDAAVEVTAKVKNCKAEAGIEQIVTVRLFDSEGNPVARASRRIGKFAPGQEQAVALKMPVANPAKWTAETPNLYTLVLMTGPGNQLQPAPAEFLSTRVGFRKIEIKN